MNKVCLVLVFFVIAGSVNAGNSYPPGDEEGTRLNLWIPVFLIKAAAGMASEYTGEVEAGYLAKMGSISLCVREGNQYNQGYDKKVQRKLNRMEKREFEELITVYDEATEVHIHMRQNDQGVIRRLVVLVDDQTETFVFVKVNCRIKAEDISSLISTAMND
jgi:hypothetical protein